MKVIVFFDMFDYPLTEFEIWKFLSVKCLLSEVQAALADGLKLETRYGFYFLPGRPETVDTRRRRYNSTERKMKRALWAARIFGFIPWIRLIAVGNMIGANNLKDESDVDLFIITERKRIWITRFFCVALAELLGWRPKPGQEKDKICLSFFLSEDGLEIGALRLEAENADEAILLKLASLGSGPANAYEPSSTYPAGREEDEDHYFTHWLAGLTPIYDAGGVYKKFMGANGWIGNYLPNWIPAAPVGRRRIKLAHGGFYRDIVDMICGGLEDNLKNYQLKHLPAYLARTLNRDTRVMANDRVIKLHANDRREEYRARYLGKLKDTWSSKLKIL